MYHASYNVIFIVGCSFVSATKRYSRVAHFDGSPMDGIPRISIRVRLPINRKNDRKSTSTASTCKPCSVFMRVIDQHYRRVGRKVDFCCLCSKFSYSVAMRILLIRPFKNFTVANAVEDNGTAADGTAAHAVRDGDGVGLDIDHAAAIHDPDAIVQDLHLLAGQRIVPDNEAVLRGVLHKVCCGLCGRANVTLYKTFLGYVCKEHRNCCYFDKDMVKEKEPKEEN